MVVIRLARNSAKKHPFYRVVVADKRSPRSGRFIEKIGFFNPLKEENHITLDMDRLNHWISVGACPSDKVKWLAKQHKKTSKQSASVEAS